MASIADRVVCVVFAGDEVVFESKVMIELERNNDSCQISETGLRNLVYLNVARSVVAAWHYVAVSVLMTVVAKRAVACSN